MCPAGVSGIVNGIAPVSCWPMFSLSLGKVPEVSAKETFIKFIIVQSYKPDNGSLCTAAPYRAAVHRLDNGVRGRNSKLKRIIA